MYYRAINWISYFSSLKRINFENKIGNVEKPLCHAGPNYVGMYVYG